MSNKPEISEEKAREIGQSFQRLAEQTERQFHEYRTALIQALEDYRESSDRASQHTKDYLRMLIAQARNMKLPSGSISQNQEEGKTATAIYEYDDELFDFLTSTNLPASLRPFGVDLQTNGILMTDKPSSRAVTIKN